MTRDMSLAAILRRVESGTTTVDDAAALRAVMGYVNENDVVLAFIRVSSQIEVVKKRINRKYRERLAALLMGD